MSVFIDFLHRIFGFCTIYYQGGWIWEIVRKIKRPVKVQKQLKTASKKNKTNFLSDFDTFGSYTGVDAFDKYDKPVQDADDL